MMMRAVNINRKGYTYRYYSIGGKHYCKVLKSSGNGRTMDVIKDVAVSSTQHAQALASQSR